MSKKHILLLSVVTFIIILLTISVWLSPCSDSLFIGLCGFGKLSVSVIFISWFLFFSVISLLIYKAKKRIKLIHYLFSAVLAFISTLISLPVGLFIGVGIYNLFFS